MMATKNRGLAWSIAETQLLIDLWSENNVLNVLDGTTRNAAVYEKFSKHLEKRGFHRTTAQIRDRMKRLKRDYKEVIDSSKAGSGRKSCHFFYELDRILGSGSFSNAVMDHDNSSPSIPLNVCQAELGKCIASDEEDEIQQVYSTHQNTPNEMVYVNGPRRVNDDGAFRSIARRRLKRGMRMEDVVNKDTVGAENGVEVGEMVKLEVEKILLEMEKLREEIGRVREERGKLALEKEVLILQRRRMLREENLEKLRMRQSELRKDEQLASFSQEMDASGIGSMNMEVDVRRGSVNFGAVDGDSVCLNEVVEAWDSNSKSVDVELTSKSGLENLASIKKKVVENREKHGLCGKLTGNISSFDGMDEAERKKIMLSELNMVDGLEEVGNSSSHPDNTSDLIISQVEGIGSAGGFCGFLNHCEKCGHATSCTGSLQMKKDV